MRLTILGAAFAALATVLVPNATEVLLYTGLGQTPAVTLRPGDTLEVPFQARFGQGAPGDTWKRITIAATYDATKVRYVRTMPIATTVGSVTVNADAATATPGVRKVTTTFEATQATAEMPILYQLEFHALDAAGDAAFGYESVTIWDGVTKNADGTPRATECKDLAVFQTQVTCFPTFKVRIEGLPRRRG